MDLADYYGSPWLTHEDIDPDNDTIVTITELEEVLLGENEAKGEEGEEKIAVHFEELPKALVLNKTNALVIGALYGSKSIEESWPGKRITLWVNHDVPYQGKVVSAIRVRTRAPKAAAKPKRAPRKRAPRKRAKKGTK